MECKKRNSGPGFCGHIVFNSLEISWRSISSELFGHGSDKPNQTSNNQYKHQPLKTKANNFLSFMTTGQESIASD